MGDARWTARFGEHLRALRERAGLTQQAVASATGLPVTSLRNWEHGRREPLAGVIPALAAALGVEVGVLFALDNGLESPRPPRGRPRRRGKSGKENP